MHTFYLAIPLIAYSSIYKQCIYFQHPPLIYCKGITFNNISALILNTLTDSKYCTRPGYDIVVSKPDLNHFVQTPLVITFLHNTAYKTVPFFLLLSRSWAFPPHPLAAHQAH